MGALGAPQQPGVLRGLRCAGEPVPRRQRRRRPRLRFDNCANTQQAARWAGAAVLFTERLGESLRRAGTTRILKQKLQLTTKKGISVTFLLKS